MAVDENAAVSTPAPHGTLPLSGRILEGNVRAGKAGLAGAARLPAPRPGDGTAARPGQGRELRRQHCRNLLFGAVVQGVEPLELRLAELARAVAGVHRVEHLPLSRRAGDDIRVARQ